MGADVGRAGCPNTLLRPEREHERSIYKIGESYGRTWAFGGDNIPSIILTVRIVLSTICSQSYVLVITQRKAGSRLFGQRCNSHNSRNGRII